MVLIRSWVQLSKFGVGSELTCTCTVWKAEDVLVHALESVREEQRERCGPAPVGSDLVFEKRDGVRLDAHLLERLEHVQNEPGHVVVIAAELGVQGREQLTVTSIIQYKFEPMLKAPISYQRNAPNCIIVHTRNGDGQYLRTSMYEDEYICSRI